MDRAEAEAHFGDGDEAGEFVPICKWWSNTSESERLKDYQDQLEERRAAEDEAYKLRQKVEALEYNLESRQSEIDSYKSFKGCTSIYQIFCLYDSMEGRALAAEERLKEETK